jgi:hypothetical protein
MKDMQCHAIIACVYIKVEVVRTIYETAPNMKHPMSSAQLRSSCAIAEITDKIA